MGRDYQAHLETARKLMRAQEVEMHRQFITK